MRSFSNTGMWRGDTLSYLLHGQFVALQQPVDDAGNSIGRINQLAHLELLVDDMTSLAMDQHEVLIELATRLLQMRRLSPSPLVVNCFESALNAFGPLGGDFLERIAASIELPATAQPRTD